MKILVIAFPRSGTTLIYRTIKKHPQMKEMIFERNVLKKTGNVHKNYLNRTFSKGKNIGEKVIYERDRMGKKNTNAPTPVDYCELWNNRFKDESRIIQIIRHPYDCWNSLLLKKYAARHIEHSIPRMLKAYFDFIPTYFNTISKFENCLTIKYEDLISNSDELIENIYTYCSLDPLFKSKEIMRQGRLFAYKRQGLAIHSPRFEKQKTAFMKILEENIEDCLKILNKFPGPEYQK